MSTEEIDAYLQKILDREAVDTNPSSPVLRVQYTLEPIIREWAGNTLLGVQPSGSFAKGTANKTGTDIDLFISLADNTNATLKEIYESLYTKMNGKGLNPKRQNVSINVQTNGFSVDLVPGKRQDNYRQDHSIYRRRVNSWTKTNITKHISHVQQSGHINEIRILKLWRNQKHLDFPSFYLELTTINALLRPYTFGLSNNVWVVFKYLCDSFIDARIEDPANTNNVISDDLTKVERVNIKAAAERVLAAKNWSEIVE